MSNYELLSLYTEYAQLIVGGVSVYISFLFAYIVASYFVAAKLTRVQFCFITLLFAGISLHLVSVIRVHGARVVSLQNEISRRIEVYGSDIAFVSALEMPDWFPTALFIFYLLASVLAVVFALSVRKADT
jgi:hypothetical protein